MHAGSNRSLLRSAVNVASVAGLPLRQSITLLDAGTEWGNMVRVPVEKE